MPEPEGKTTKPKVPKKRKSPAKTPGIKTPTPKRVIGSTRTLLGNKSDRGSQVSEQRRASRLSSTSLKSKPSKLEGLRLFYPGIATYKGAQSRARSGVEKGNVRPVFASSTPRATMLTMKKSSYIHGPTKTASPVKSKTIKQKS
jgi:hypothetical protein